jgi:energy-coupling factor transporter ATP-binding protein EcfA2
MSSIEGFQLPIFYIDYKGNLPPNLIDDLELNQLKTDPSLCIYDYIFPNQSDIGKKTFSLWSEYVTWDVSFLRQSQSIIDNSSTLLLFDSSHADLICDTERQITALSDENNFAEKYQYLDWDWCQFLNKSSTFMQASAFYSLTSPVISLIMPILFLILPFFLLRFRGVQLTLASYFSLLKEVARYHAFGKLFTEFGSGGWDKRFYLLMSTGFYLFQVYQNIASCMRFHHNMKRIHSTLMTVKDYLVYTKDVMDRYCSIANELTLFKPFCKQLTKRRDTLEGLYNSLSDLSPYGLSFRKIGEVGKAMSYFYILKTDKDINEALQYSFLFHGYCENLGSLTKQIINNKLGLCRFVNSGDKQELREAAYPPLVSKNDTKVTRNNISLSKNQVITGPNASGKTTLLKTVLLNIILVQQAGVGYFKKASFTPYTQFHCYLNIPDTSGRDSLFQAEARRCKEILDNIDNNNNQVRHLCIFDELYSGTNPYEAIASASSFLEYISKLSNVTFYLTTHFTAVCENVKSNKKIKNYHMETVVLPTIDDEITEYKYTFKQKSGISRHRGGLTVLRDLGYPKDITTRAQKIIRSVTV